MKARLFFLFLYFTMLTCIHAESGLSDISSWAYQLQNIDIDAIAQNSTFELIVIDYSADGSDEQAFSRIDIQKIQNSGKKVIAYLSIGEAETYRFYWQNEWDSNNNGRPDAGAPSWLGNENPEWEGNYKVRFWDSEWQTIIMSYLDKIIDQGFDGIYMDIIDAYYYWAEENGEQPNADALMIDFVLNLRHHVEANGLKDFIFVPQNGEYIIVEPHVTEFLKEAYWEAIDAIGVEDVFFYGDKDNNNTYNPDEERLDILNQYRDAGKPVFSIEYLTDTNKIEQYHTLCQQHQFIPYTTARELDHLFDGVYTTVDDVNLIPVRWNLEPCFPNPFNAATLLTYRSDRKQNISLFLFNEKGQLLDVLLNGAIKAGTHQVPIILDAQSSGLYLISGYIGEKRISKKIMLIK